MLNGLRSSSLSGVAHAFGTEVIETCRCRVEKCAVLAVVKGGAVRIDGTLTFVSKLNALQVGDELKGGHEHTLLSMIAIVFSGISHVFKILQLLLPMDNVSGEGTVPDRSEFVRGQEGDKLLDGDGRFGTVTGIDLKLAEDGLSVAVCGVGAYNLLAVVCGEDRLEDGKHVVVLETEELFVWVVDRREVDIKYAGDVLGMCLCDKGSLP